MIGPHAVIGMNLLSMGDLEAALEEFALTPLEQFQVFGRASVFHAMGRQQEAEAKMQEYIDGWGDGRPQNVAGLHAWFGQIDRAF
jgi:hypothetical protein